MMEQNYCLNCSEEITKKFCPNCGQKTDTHRITLKHFLFHDLLHGVWHIDKGILFTIKQIMTRPGRAALDYINGKRQPYYNVFYLSLIALGINVIFNHYINSLYPEPIGLTSKGSKVDSFISDNMKFFIFGAVPLLSLNAMLFFKRLKFNFAEHVIISGINVLGMILLNLLYFVFFLADLAYESTFSQYMVGISAILLLLYPAYVLYDATKNTYRFWEFLWRIFMFYLLISSELFLLIILLMYVLTGKSLLLN